MQDIEMNTYEGVCKYCGNIQPVMALNQSDADMQISEGCACSGAERERRKKQLLQNIRETVGQDAPNFGYTQKSREQEELITTMALAVFHSQIEAASAKIDGTTVSIKESGGKVKIQRTDTKRSERSA